MYRDILNIKFLIVSQSCKTRKDKSKGFVEEKHLNIFKEKVVYPISFSINKKSVYMQKSKRKINLQSINKTLKKKKKKKKKNYKKVVTSFLCQL